MIAHVPVLTTEALQYLRAERGGVYVDCTVGLGGHARALLEAGATRVIGVDRDLQALAVARETLAPWAERVELVHADYRDLDEVLDQRGIRLVNGALADLGVSSLQFDTPGRGFSFQRDEPLDMRMDTSIGDTAAALVARSTERELADGIYAYGEERFSRRIARAIVAARREQPIETTGRLAAIVRRALPRRGHMRIDPATRTFQALRIWVNRELEGLDRFLEASGPPAARGRAPRGDHVPLARGPHRQAHAAGAGARRRGGREGADEEAPRAERRGSASQSAGAQRQAAGSGASGLTLIRVNNG